ncbi:MAG: pitrilysin family protein [Proteobacteria bacterium]|nr:pitrilysin family protein [Pseudomonadota bacterium]
MKIKILSNELNSVVVKNPSSDVVSVQIWVRCGSIFEKEGEYGASHFIEHLLFKGTEKYGVGEIAKEMESLGGDLNAFTAKEYTCYYITLPSIHLKKGLATLKDLVFGPTFIKEDIDSEREVIVEEIRRYQDIPGSVASENFFDIHFKGHPYSRPILGFEDVIRNITREKIVDYYSRFYTASNSLLVICGNVSEPDVFRIVDELFGGLKSIAHKETKIPLAEQKIGQSCKIHNMDVNELTLIFGFPIPGLMHEDIPSLDILGLALGQGDSSRLVKTLRVEKGIVSSIGSYAYTPKYGGTFNISFTLDGMADKIDKKIENVFASIHEEIEKLKNDISDDEIEKAKTILLSDKVYEREKVETLASKLGHLISVTGGVEFEKTYFDGLRKTNRAQIIKVIDKYMNPANISISVVLPKNVKIDDKKLLDLFNNNFKAGNKKQTSSKEKTLRYRSKVSVVDSITGDNDYDFGSNIAIEKPELIKHKSGAKIIMRKMTSTPLVSIKILMPGGVLFEDETTNGLSNLVARTIAFGAENLSFSDIANIVDSTASNLTAFSGRNTIGFSADFMKPFFKDMLDITAKIILKPKFKQEFFDTEKKIIEDEIKSAEDNLGHYARLLLLKTMYRKYPYRFDLLGTIENVRRFKRADAMAFYKKLLAPDRMIFSVTGDFDKKEFMEWVDELLSKIDNPKEKIETLEQEPEQTENRITKFQKETKQAHIFVAYKTCGLRSKDKYVLSVIDSIFGGQSGRLFLDLRDKQSLAYTVAPIELYGPDTGYFGVYIASENNKADKAIEEIRKQFKKLRDENTIKEEIERAKNFVIGRNAISMQSFSEQATTMGFDEMFGDGYMTMLNYSESILSVTDKDIARIAKKYFKDRAENISIVSS